MHSSPIDLLARAPGQPKTAPPESDSDGRFSDLLRQPADDPAPPSPARPDEPAATPVQDGPAQGEAAAAVATEIPEDAAGGDTGDNIARGSESFIEALAIIPDAITHDVPAGAPLSPQLSVETPIAGAAGNALPIAGPAVPSYNVPTDSPVPTNTGQAGSVPAAASAPMLPSGPKAPPALQANPGSATPAAPAPTATAIATGSVSEGSDRPAPKPPMLVISDAAGAAPGTAGDVRPAATAGAQATSTVTTPSASAGIVAPAASAGLAASAKQTASLRGAVEAPAQGPISGAVESPDLAEEPDLQTVLASPKATRKSAGTPIAGQGAPAASTPTGDKSFLMTTPEAKRPEATVADRSPAGAPTDPAGAVASSPSTRPAPDPATIVQASQSNAAPPPAAEQVVLQLRKAVANGVDRMTVQLKPATLGRVDVQMEVGHDGRVQAVISAERPETLHLLQRDARTLTTALADAGLQADSGSLSFNLRGQTGDQAGDGHRPASDGPDGSSDAGAEDGDDVRASLTLTLGDGRVDIKV